MISSCSLDTCNRFPQTPVSTSAPCSPVRCQCVRPRVLVWTALRDGLVGIIACVQICSNNRTNLSAWGYQGPTMTHEKTRRIYTAVRGDDAILLCVERRNHWPLRTVENDVSSPAPPVPRQPRRVQYLPLHPLPTPHLAAPIHVVKSGNPDDNNAHDEGDKAGNRSKTPTYNTFTSLT